MAQNIPMSIEAEGSLDVRQGRFCNAFHITPIENGIAMVDFVFIDHREETEKLIKAQGVHLSRIMLSTEGIASLRDAIDNYLKQESE